MSYKKYFKVVIITIFDDCTIFKYMDGHLLFVLPWWLRRQKNLPMMQETHVQSLGWEDPLEKGIYTHFTVLVWRISWTEEPGGLQSMKSKRVGHD